MDIRSYNKKAEVRTGTLSEEEKKTAYIYIGSCDVEKNTSVSLKSVLSAVNYRDMNVLKKTQKF
jgi:hypothetical protein